MSGQQELIERLKFRAKLALTEGSAGAIRRDDAHRLYKDLTEAATALEANQGLREALLSDEAVRAAALAWEFTSAFGPRGIREGLEAALDTIDRGSCGTCGDEGSIPFDPLKPWWKRVPCPDCTKSRGSDG